MPVKRHQQPAAEKKDENEACASLLGIHPVNFFLVVDINNVV